jgi:quinol monooxygenase YgiN
MRFARFVLALVAIALAAAAPARAQDAAQATIYVVRYIEVAPGTETKAAGLLAELATASRKEAGNQRFEILQRVGAANQYATFEIWKDKEAQDAHLAAAPAKSFAAAVGPSLLAPIDDRPCIGADAAPLMPAAGDARYVITHVDFAPPVREKGLGFLKEAAAAARKENGSLGWGAYQQTARNNHFEVVELWKDEKANDAHEMLPATREFRANVQPLLGAHYDRRWYKAL